MIAIYPSHEDTEDEARCFCIDSSESQYKSTAGPCQRCFRCGRKASGYTFRYDREDVNYRDAIDNEVFERLLDEIKGKKRPKKMTGGFTDRLLAKLDERLSPSERLKARNFRNPRRKHRPQQR